MDSRKIPLWEIQKANSNGNTPLEFRFDELRERYSGGSATQAL